jgi:hypothetical protein
MNFGKTESPFIIGSRIQWQVLDEPDMTETTLTYLKWQGLLIYFGYCLQKSMRRGREASWLEIPTSWNRKMCFSLRLRLTRNPV